MCIRDRHFTLNKNMFGPDHRMSLSPKELIDSVKEIRDAESSLGSYEKKIINSEKDNRKKLKKSIVAAFNIKKGQIIKGKFIKVKRPGFSPKTYQTNIGAKIASRRTSNETSAADIYLGPVTIKIVAIGTKIIPSIKR